MPGIVVVGSQWGDEGKGKVVDLLSERVDVVARYQGGNNAGHTVMFEDKQFILHLIPSGIFWKGKLTVLGNGVVVDPQALLDEIAELRRQGVYVGENLKVSDEANLIMPYHKAFDKLRENLKGAGKIGTTGRGIGPAYEDKMGREGLRFCEFRAGNARALRERLGSILEEKNVLLRSHFRSDAPLFDLNQILDQYAALCEQVQPHLCDSSAALNDALDAGKTVLFEGAQGTHLDVDHGTYPFVTSSNTTAGGACTGCGVGPTKIARVIGITKAYTTRVGEGPFPTELRDDPIGRHLQARGQEVGATTGRVRRCGWFDAVVVREAVRLSGMTGLAMMKLDVLDELDTLKIAVAYRDREGHTHESMPHWIGTAGGITPVYEEWPGWRRSIRGITEYAKLPQAAIAYLDRIAELTRVPIGIVSTGPRREETILLDRGL
ncbi:MAG: adenylosuccinate synthase [Candidatus Lambdaproteobacteria bacterium]|nr:adenylosuccinate synthase [Candidatus Lambdaproteobacteria bacterium]